MSTTHVALPVAVRASPQRDERRGLHGRDGFKVEYPDGNWAWFDADTFKIAFKPSAAQTNPAYWEEP